MYKTLTTTSLIRPYIIKNIVSDCKRHTEMLYIGMQTQLWFSLKVYIYST